MNVMHQPPYCLNSNSCAFVSTLSRITLHFRVPCFWTIWWSLAVSSKLCAFSDYWFQVFHFSSSNDVKVIWQRKCCMLQPFVRIRTAQNFTSIYPKWCIVARLSASLLLGVFSTWIPTQIWLVSVWWSISY
jgi:hypothetical protein